MWKVFTGGVCLLLLTTGVFWAQEKQPQQSKQPSPSTAPGPTTTTAAPPVHTFVITPEDKARKNPEKFTEESVKEGKSVYTTQCAMCHGTTGNGKGDLAGVMHLTLPDMTDPATLAKFTDGEIFAMISSGSGPMPGEAHRMQTKTIWDLVNFLRSVEGKTPMRSPHKGSR